jgi:hypothetical protein
MSVWEKSKRVAASMGSRRAVRWPDVRIFSRQRWVAGVDQVGGPNAVGEPIFGLFVGSARRSRS